MTLLNMPWEQKRTTVTYWLRLIVAVHIIHVFGEMSQCQTADTAVNTLDYAKNNLNRAEKNTIANL